MSSVLTLQTDFVVMNEANAARHSLVRKRNRLIGRRLMAQRIMILLVVEGDIAVHDLLHGHGDGVLAGKGDRDVVHILNGKNAAVLAAEHVVDIARALRRERGEKEPVVIGLLEQIIDMRLNDRHGTSVPFILLDDADELGGGTIEVVVDDDLIVSIRKLKFLASVCEAQLKRLSRLGSTVNQTLAQNIERRRLDEHEHGIGVVLANLQSALDIDFQDER